MDEILKRDQNHVTVLAGVTDDSDQDITMLRVDPISKRLLIKANFSGSIVTSLNGLTGAITLAAGSNITITPSGNTLTFASSGGGTPVNNEIVAGNTNTFTLANTPILNSEHVFGNGQRLTPSGVDYTISGAVITTINPFSAGQILADYQK